MCYTIIVDLLIPQATLRKIYNESATLVVALFGYLLGYQNADETLKDKQVIKFIDLFYDKELERANTQIQYSLLHNIKVKRINELHKNNQTTSELLIGISEKLTVLNHIVKYYNNSLNLGVSDLKCITFLYSCYLRYLIGYNDEWIEVEKPDDTIFKDIEWIIIKVFLGGNAEDLSIIKDALNDSEIWQMDLKREKIYNKILQTYVRLMEYQGAVRDLLMEITT